MSEHRNEKESLEQGTGSQSDDEESMDTGDGTSVDDHSGITCPGYESPARTVEQPHQSNDESMDTGDGTSVDDHSGIKCSGYESPARTVEQPHQSNDGIKTAPEQKGSSLKHAPNITRPQGMSQAERRERRPHQEKGRNTSGHSGQKHFPEQSTSSEYQQTDVQTQQQKQLQRSLEASKQMVYGVFGNVIAILEEYEQRELEQVQIQPKMPKSDIYIPPQKHKTNNDIKSIVECQLLLFETQTKACPPEVLSELHEELKRRTLGWSAVRGEVKGIQQTDRYITRLYEILAKGSTFHQPMRTKRVTAEVMKNNFPAILKGLHDLENTEREFKTNPDKKATSPNTRSSELIKKGSDRISSACRDCGNESLKMLLEEDVKRFQPYTNTDDVK